MADPVVSALASGSSSTASTAVTFTAQPAGTLLLLTITGDDYPTATPTGFTAVQTIAAGSGSFHGNGMWFKVAVGNETSVTYTIGSASRSAYKLSGIAGLLTSSPLDVSAKANSNSSVNTYTSTTVAPTTGDRFIVVGFSASNGGSLLTAPSVGSPYTGQGSGLSTTAPGLSTTHATLPFTGNGSTTTSATATWTGTTPEARSAIIAAFKVAAGVTATRFRQVGKRR